MAEKLPSKGLKEILHIALFILLFLSGMQLKAQSVLLPGDVVVVSVHADTQAVDIIPLIDIEQGTEFFLSDGKWIDSTKTLTGNELKISFRKSIQAGTNIHINNLDDERIELNGKLAFTGESHHLFVYQKESDIHRFVFGLGWGDRPIWNEVSADLHASDIPAALKLNKDALVTLGNKNYYQYYVRNGASGTRSMLLKYVGDASHWRGNDQLVYPAFGTSFKLLEPPVVLFGNSVSTVVEGDSAAILNVAIYGHDGSRLTVDVAFDSLHSTMSHRDISGFEGKRINFTGLVGDAVYEVKVPITDDEVLDGRETGIFTLQNLAKGNFGDFLTHSLILQDNDIPELMISEIERAEGNQSFVSIRNEEEVEVSLKGWGLRTERGKFTFEQDIFIAPQQSLTWVEGVKDSQGPKAKNQIYSDLDKALLKAGGGTLTLINPAGDVISEFRYSAIKNGGNIPAKPEVIADDNPSQQADKPVNEQNVLVNSEVSAALTPTFSWKILTDKSEIEALPEDHIVYKWDKEQLKFAPYSQDFSIESQNLVLFGFVENTAPSDSAIIDSTLQKNVEQNENLKLELSALDKNENELIDGLEGLNLAVNQLENSISAGKLLEQLRTTDTDSDIHPALYSIQNDTYGEMNFVKLDVHDQILAGAAFWVLLNSPMETNSIEIPRSELTQSEFETVTEQDLNSDKGRVKIWVEAEGYNDFITIEVTDSTRGFSNKDLNAYPGLYLRNQPFMNVAFAGGEEFYNTISVISTTEQKMAIPLSVSTSESGIISFNIVEFENIPADWNLQLEDKLNEKHFEISKDAVLNFKNTVPGVISESDREVEISLEDFTIPNRFVLHITPAASEATVEEEIDLPRKLELHQNFPNPFNPVTTISFYLPEPEEIKLSVFNIVGQPVAVITEGRLSAGEHQFEWDATNKPSGMYIYQLEAGKSVLTRKMTLVK